jgi:hypothetical protein
MSSNADDSLPHRRWRLDRIHGLDAPHHAHPHLYAPLYRTGSSFLFPSTEAL